MGKWKRWTEKENREFVRDWISYINAKDMSIKYGVTYETVSRHARSLGLEPRVIRRKKVD